MAERQSTGISHLFRVIAFSIIAVITLSACSISPKPITSQEYEIALTADLARLPDSERVIASPISLEEALIRAVRNNREVRLKAMEAALARGEVRLEALGMLPQLTAEAGYTERDVYDASTSVVLIDGEPDRLPSEPAYSVSDGLNQRTAQVGFSWNVLDFGLSYVRAKQRSDQYLISEERERKSIHTISEEVRGAYWKAVSADRLLGRVGALRVQAESALEAARQMEESRAMAPREALIYQRELLDVLRLLQDLEQRLSGAKIQLADLMGLHPGTEYTLADSDAEAMPIPALQNTIQELEAAALRYRPEMREAHYQTRVSVNETRAALLRLLPGIGLTATMQYEDNKYLRDDQWQTLGASVNWNLFNVFAISPNLDAAEVRGQLAEARRMAVSMAVMTQVHLAVSDFMQARQVFELASDYRDVAGRILTQTEAQAQAQSIGELDAVREALNDILAELRRDRAYADMQNAFGRLAASAGVDLFPRDHAELPAGVLTDILEARYQQFISGDLPLEPPKTRAEIEAERLANLPPPPPPPVWTPERQRALSQKATAETRTSDEKTGDLVEPPQVIIEPAPESDGEVVPQPDEAEAPADDVWTPEKQREFNERSSQEVRVIEDQHFIMKTAVSETNAEGSGWWVFGGNQHQDDSNRQPVELIVGE